MELSVTGAATRSVAFPRVWALVRLVAALCVPAALLAAPSAAQPGTLVLTRTELTAPDGTRVGAEEGTFEVLENRGRPEGGTISLALLRIPSSSPTAGPPIVFLAGGPGNSGIERVRGGLLPAALRLVELSDVIALDQRGTGDSVPSLECPVRQRLEIPADRPFDVDETLDLLQEASGSCAARLRRGGVDLDAYNTEESAADLDELRQALGEPSMVLWGASYGTHLAMATIRRYGEHVERAILHGPEGPDHTLKLPRSADQTLRALAREIRADPAVGPSLPDAVGTLRRLIDTLDREPATLVVRGQEVTFGGQDLALLFALEIGADDFFQLVPRLLVTAERGDYTLLGEFAAGLREPVRLNAMSFAMDCASGASPGRRRKAAKQARRALLGGLLNFPFPAVCDAWSVADLGQEFRSRLRTDVPTLFLAGTLDGRTPVQNAKSLRRGFRTSELVVLEGASHERVVGADERVVEVLVDFLAGRPLETDTISYQPLSFEPVD